MYDKKGEEHYNLISALHKSVRNSDADASLYWLGRMLQAGEDPLYVARRIVRMAVEDIGLAAPEALNLCLSARDAMVDFLGSPEGDLALAEAVVFLALAPKSNAVYTAYGAVLSDIEATRPGTRPPPPAQRPDEADEGTRLRQGLPVRPRRRGQSRRHGLPARIPPPAAATTTPPRKAAKKLLAQSMEEIARLREAKRK
jgi:putative ATPase